MQWDGECFAGDTPLPLSALHVHSPSPSMRVISTHATTLTTRTNSRAHSVAEYYERQENESDTPGDWSPGRIRLFSPGYLLRALISSR